MRDVGREAQNRKESRPRPFFLHLLPLLTGIGFSGEDAIGWLDLA
jgi:hypothetical protein